MRACVCVVGGSWFVVHGFWLVFDGYSWVGFGLSLFFSWLLGDRYTLKVVVELMVVCRGGARESPGGRDADTAGAHRGARVCVVCMGDDCCLMVMSWWLSLCSVDVLLVVVRGR